MSVPAALSVPEYMYGRLSNSAGYSVMPQVLTGLTFDLPVHLAASSRLVANGEQIFELWSMNSKQLPYLPRVQKVRFLSSVITAREQKRYDGHAGRHDCLHAPQYYREDTKHWPFMRRVREVAPKDLYYVFYQPLTLVWTRSPNPREGTFQDEASDCQKFVSSSLWGSKPSYTSAEAINSLWSVKTWDDAVDQGVALQHGLRELDAWLRFMELRLSLGNLTLEELRRVRWAATREQYIGMWLNGASEEVALRLLVLGIPCFVVHAYAHGEVQWMDSFQQMWPNFFDGSDLVEVIGATNPYYQVAMENAKVNAFY
ncbi:hypothetical protein B0H19DRAFT_1261288 [Mycena capillaripes]|nr:hypothetical protein B0H19DRAFT_1261288 [Mycena capillaripes]